MKSPEHWTSHSVPGIRFQQTAVQSSWTVENTVRWFKAALVLDVDSGVEGIVVEKPISHSKLQSISPSKTSRSQTSVHWLFVAVTVGVTVGVTVDMAVDVADSVVMRAVEPISWHQTSQSEETPSQIAVQSPLVTVTAACRLARIGLPVTLVALTVHIRLMRPKTTDLVTSILPTVIRRMDAKKDVRVVYWSLSDDMGCSDGSRAML